MITTEKQIRPKCWDMIPDTETEKLVFVTETASPLRGVLAADHGGMLTEVMNKTGGDFLYLVVTTWPKFLARLVAAANKHGATVYRREPHGWELLTPTPVIGDVETAFKTIQATFPITVDTAFHLHQQSN